MKIGIIAAMEEEVKTLVENTENYKEVKIANQLFYDGVIRGNEVTLVQSGIGKVNASIAASLLIEQFNADIIINTGSAGGIREGLSVGDLVISDELSYNDADARVFGYKYGQIPQMPESYKADSSLVEKIEESASVLKWNIHRGLIVTGDSFVAGNKQLDNIKEFFPEALVTEMEGTAIAQTCYQFDVPFVVIRALSDSADEEAGVSFDEFITEAGKKSAQLIIHFVESLA